MSEYDIRLYRPGDEAGILRSFNRVFGEVCGPGYQDRDMEFWRWQYQHNPQGHRISLAVTEAGEIAAHYAGVPYLMATAYGDTVFTHVVDSFALPEHRAGLKRPGLFVETAYPWFDHCHEQGDAVMYGYPVKAAERVGKRYLHYDFFKVVDYLCRDVDQAGGGMPGGMQFETVTGLPVEVDELFARFASERSCLVRRDRSYLDWRYLQIPSHPYQVHLARRGGELVGLMVLRPQHELVPQVCTIADWIVPDVDPEVTEGLLARAAEVARGEGRLALMTVFAVHSPEFAVFVELGFEVRPSSLYLERLRGFRIHDQRFTAEWLAQNWWHTLGDSDLV